MGRQEMNKHEKRAKEYEEKHMPKEPSKKNLAELDKLCKELGSSTQLYKDISEKIKGLKLPTVIVNFAMDHPNLTITSTTDKLCSVFCAADSIKKMPFNASDVHIEDDKINFKVLLD